MEKQAKFVADLHFERRSISRTTGSLDLLPLAQKSDARLSAYRLIRRICFLF